MQKVKFNKQKLVAVLAVCLILAALTMSVGVCFAAGEITVTWSVDGVETTSLCDTGAVPTLPTTTPAKTGYTFEGWGLSATGTAVLTTMPALYANTTFYAIFKPLTYEITWVYYNTAGILVTETDTVNYGVVPTAPDYSATVNGSQFVAWDSAVAAATTNKTYTATYNHAQYIVTYISGAEDTQEQIYASGVVDVSGQTAEPLDGYTFRGWTTRKDDRTTMIDENYRVKANTTLYAYYTINAESWFLSLAWYWQTAIIAGCVLVVLVVVAIILKKIKG